MREFEIEFKREFERAREQERERERLRGGIGWERKAVRALQHD